MVKMKLLGLAALLLAGAESARADSRSILECTIGHLPPIACAYIAGEALKPAVEKIPGAWDKFKHCTLSCQIGLVCPPVDTLLLGLGKEIVDVFGPGNAEWADLKADHYGTMLSLTPAIKNNKHCIKGCSMRYPLQK